jgi:uncharacterized protein YndB with AHSA1/START domain
MAHDDLYSDAKTTTERVARDLLIPALPEDVWDVITDDGWLAERVELELEPGGEARFTDPAQVRTGWIEEARPPDLAGHATLVFWWGPEGEPATRVELVLEPEVDGGTRLWVAETRPLEQLDLVGLPLPGQRGASPGPAMLAVA